MYSPQMQVKQAVEEAEAIARELGLAVIGGDGATVELPDDPVLKDMIEAASKYLQSPMGINTFDVNMEAHFKR